MRRLGVLALTVRTALAVLSSAVGCNLILGNEPRNLVEVTDGGSSGSVATASESLGSTSTGESGASGAGEAGRGGAPPDAGGAAGAEGGEAGEGTEDAAAASGGSSSTSSTGVACVCIPGHTESVEEPCGNCGTATLTKLCNENCQWDPYGPAGECMNQGVCTPSEPLHEYGHCELGGWRDRTTTCGDDCQPGLWTDGDCEWGPNPCTGCSCVSECTDSDTGGGTTCLWIDCTEEQARAECDEDIQARCGTPNQPVTLKEWLPN